MPNHRIIITETLDPTCAAWLEEHAEVVWCSHDDPNFAGELAKADALVVRTYTQVNAALLQQAPKLKVIGRAGVGLDNFDLPACEVAGVKVVYTPDANTQAVVEYVIGLILDDLRPRTTFSGAGPIEGDVFHQLRKTEVGRQFDQLTLGILGFGRIGKRLCRAGQAMNINVHVCDLIPAVESAKHFDTFFEQVDHAKLYAESDILSIHVDGRPENKNLVNEAMLNQLKPSCLLINAARGSLVNSNDLAVWLKTNQAQGARAILDVHDPEPPPADYPLYGLDNCKLLPHLASRTNEALANMSWVVRDVVRVLQDEPPQWPAY